MPLASLFGYGIIVQALAIVHFIRRRPDTYWLWIILIGGGLGALVYIFCEVLPDTPLLVQGFQVFPRRSRINRLQAIILDNPSAGNYEELAALYLEDKKYALAKECYDQAISSRTDSPDPFYRRALCEIELNEYAAAEADLRRVIAMDPNYDYQRAKGLFAHVLAKTGQDQEADSWFRNALQTSTLSETMTNYAEFLHYRGRNSESREWAQKVLDKKRTLPAYLKRRERPWFRRASYMLKQLPA